MALSASAAVCACVSVLVVRGALLIVGQGFVSLFGFLELFFRFGIVRIAVRMKLHRQFAISFFNFVCICVFIDAKNFIIIFF
jgi:hypothetical protein